MDIEPATARSLSFDKLAREFVCVYLCGEHMETNYQFLYNVESLAVAGPQCIILS